MSEAGDELKSFSASVPNRKLSTVLLFLRAMMHKDSILPRS
ncbi:hypothetical protein SynSYN20_01870 [Synechococcus sp. SYN20]|nr:hypothetical protein SynSYN20_01870 [Synechococcus sp. SYN20]